MCQHLIDKGYPATVYNRSRDKAKPLLDAGAAWADSPKGVAERSDVVFAIVGFPRDVREVFLGGAGTVWGPVLGAFILVPAQQWLAYRYGASELYLIAYAGVFVLVLLLLPRGIVPSLADLVSRRRFRATDRPDVRPTVERVAS